MANTSELEKGLNELKRLTGITLAKTLSKNRWPWNRSVASALPTGKNIIKMIFLWD